MFVHYMYVCVHVCMHVSDLACIPSHGEYEITV